MKAAILLTASGPMAVLTSHPSLEAPGLLDRLRGKGIDKFLGFDLPIDSARAAYGPHFTIVLEDHTQSDELRVLDEDGRRIFAKFRFGELGPMTTHEPQAGGTPPADPAAMI